MSLSSRRSALRSELPDDSSLVFDPTLTCPDADWLAEQMYESYVARREADHSRRKRRPRRNSGYLPAFKALVANLVKMRRLGKTALAVSMDTNRYTARYNASRISGPAIRAAVDFLSGTPAVEIRKGCNYPTANFRRLSRLTPSTELMDLLPEDATVKRHLRGGTEVIRLKDAQGRLKSYTDTGETNEMRDNVNGLNALLARTQVELNGKALPPQRFHRTFNNGAFDQGGRFYGDGSGNVQNRKSEERRRLKLNGSEVVELDFSGMHWRMLYCIEGGTEKIADPFIIDGYNRADVKLVGQMMLNAKKTGVVRAYQGEVGTSGLNRDEIKAIMMRLEEQHPLIAKHFYRCPALWLQCLDSYIAERVIGHFVKKGIPILPVHDSFIVPVQHRAELEAAMEEAWGFYLETPGCAVIK